jgi:RHS repeat-associated protein
MVSPGGNVLAETGYEPYGRAVVLSGTTGQAFGFGGYPTHAPSGLSLAWFREYDAGLGTWLSRDPMGEASGLNLYEYVEGDPINLIDPLGLDPEALNYFPPSELHDNYDKIAADPDVIAVGAHGSERGFTPPVTVEKLVKDITETQKWQSGVRTVRLDICNSGKGPAPGPKQVLDALAKTLRPGDKVTVLAPDAFVWVGPDGQRDLTSKMKPDGKFHDGKGQYQPFSVVVPRR